MDYIQNTELPYDFDMLWNIKTKIQLVSEYLQAKQKVLDIEEVCQSHNMDINKLVEVFDKLSSGKDLTLPTE